MKRNPIILALCVSFVVISALLYFSAHASVKQPVLKEPQGQQPPSDIKTYTNAVQGFSLSYKDGMKIDEGYTYENLQNGKSITGVSFAFPRSFAAGTNLSSDSHVAVEWKDGTACELKEFTDDPATAIKMQTINGREWSVASTSGAGAGNFYEEVLYTQLVSAHCFNFRLFLHSINIGNYPQNSVVAFDRSSIDQIFMQMVSSFAYKATSTPT